MKPERDAVALMLQRARRNSCSNRVRSVSGTRFLGFLFAEKKRGRCAYIHTLMCIYKAGTSAPNLKGQQTLCPSCIHLLTSLLKYPFNNVIIRDVVDEKTICNSTERHTHTVLTHIYIYTLLQRTISANAHTL